MRNERLIQKHKEWRRLWWVSVWNIIALPTFAVPSFNEVKSNWRASDVIFLDRTGSEIQRIRVDKKVRKLDWVKLDDISSPFQEALIASEDKRFYEHNGIDWAAVTKAGWSNLWNDHSRGASTLTMQLGGLIDLQLQRSGGRRSVWQKLNQGLTARELEKSWSKAQIVEAYLNLVSFRGELLGISALSAVMFGKAPSGLNLQESAIAVALLRAPNASAWQVSQRACHILKEMKREENCQAVLGKTVLAFARRGLNYQPTEPMAPHFARKWLNRFPYTEPGSRIRTTLDGDLQRYATTVLKRHLGELSHRNVEDGAILVLDNRTGDILAWVGSSGHFSQAAEVDGVTAVRQAGSVLKPFLYQIALDGKWLNAASLLEDRPINLGTQSGLYSPQNYSRDFKGPVSLRTALASSLNIPAVRVIEMVTPERFHQRLLTVGMKTLDREGDYYGYSLALGAADIRLYDVTNAYRTLANLGKQSEPRWTLTAPISTQTQILDEKTSFIIGDILSDRTARARGFGLESALGTPFWSAVKTGTSKDMRDNWTIGYSRHYTVGVWVGNASGAPMWDVSGMHGAAPIWLSLMKYLHQHGKPSLPPPLPQGIEKVRVHFQGEIEANREEYFLPGTKQATVYFNADDKQENVPRIVAPIEGAIYAIDPDIPPRHQKIVFQSSGVEKPSWWLNAKRIGQGKKVFWGIWPGKHTLQLRDEAGQALETLNFEVRGVLLKENAKLN